MNVIKTQLKFPSNNKDITSHENIRKYTYYIPMSFLVYAAYSLSKYLLMMQDVFP